MNIVDRGNENFLRCTVEIDGDIKAFTPESIFGYILTDGRKFISQRLITDFVDKEYFFQVLYEGEELRLLYVKRRKEEYYISTDNSLEKLNEVSYKDQLEAFVPICDLAKEKFEKLKLTPRHLKNLFSCDRVDKTDVVLSAFYASSLLYSDEAGNSPLLSSILKKQGQLYGIDFQLFRKIGSSNSYFVFGGTLGKHNFSESREINFINEGEVQRTEYSVEINSLFIETPIGYRLSPKFGILQPYAGIYFLLRANFMPGDYMVTIRSERETFPVSEVFQTGAKAAAGLSFHLNDNISLGLDLRYSTIGNSSRNFSETDHAFGLFVVIK